MVATSSGADGLHPFGYQRASATPAPTSNVPGQLIDDHRDAAVFFGYYRSVLLQSYVRAPEPQGGVQEWWARTLSGSLNNSQSASGCPAIGESL